MTTVLGLDIGGTHTRARLVSDGALVAEARAGSASLTAAGRTRASEVLDELLSKLPMTSGLRLDAICVGSAGTGAGEGDAYLRGRLGPMTATGTVLVVNDAHLVLAAERLEDGVALVAGTGSIALGRHAGREERAGGWGYLLGDEGSGYWIVREALREVARRQESHAPVGPLGVALMDATGEGDLATVMLRFYERVQPDKWARHAELVLATPDASSDAIRAAAAGALATIAVAVIERLEAPEALPVVLGGGLLVGSHPLASLTRCAIETAIPGTPVLTASEPPVAGAVHLALAAAG